MEDIERLSQISKDLKVLYVEDDTLVRSKTASLLKSFFDYVDTANDGVEGIEKYEHFYHKHRMFYDIVISDIRMPNIDGIQMCRYILESNPKQQIMITSAYDDSKYLIEFINMGVKKFLHKPFSTQSVIESLLSICLNLVKDEVSEIILLGDSHSWNKREKILKKNDTIVKLSFNELIIFDTLISNPNKIFSSYDLYNSLKFDNLEYDFSIDSVKSAIKRIRKKLPDEVIVNIYGQGYKINNEILKIKNLNKNN